MAPELQPDYVEPKFFNEYAPAPGARFMLAAKGDSAMCTDYCGKAVCGGLVSPANCLGSRVRFPANSITMLAAGISQIGPERTLKRRRVECQILRAKSFSLGRNSTVVFAK